MRDVQQKRHNASRYCTMSLACAMALSDAAVGIGASADNGVQSLSLLQHVSCDDGLVTVASVAMLQC